VFPEHEAIKKEVSLLRQLVEKVVLGAGKMKIQRGWEMTTI
jgi:hypothetical protein